ncbi:MAG: hypothetical protein LAN71_04115 [Acidobacteriia bacterium]|nr:hypothetical protein [Terriglobia bacterium]
MAIFDLFSKRKKRQESQGKPDVYQYDAIPQPFKIQVAHIWRAALGRWFRPTGYYTHGEASPASELWELIQKTMAEEKGLWAIGQSDSDPEERCIQYLMTADTDGTLDIIELSFKVIDRFARDFNPYQQQEACIKLSANEAIEDLNVRFREHGIGYQYISGDIIRVDSQFLHAEAVKPALALLNETGFSGPADEFMRAFDHHRKGDNKQAIAEALKAFESTMKSICTMRKWSYGPKDTAKPLMDILFTNGLVPPELETHFGGLRSAMESGLPTLANRTSRHGQGVTPVEIPLHFAAYALHLVASNIVFLIECHKAKK